MKSQCIQTGTIELPLIFDEHSMIPFDLVTLGGLPVYFKVIVEKMVSHIKQREGIAFFTIHGKELKKGNTLRRGGPHTDGSYKLNTGWGTGGGWKVNQDGPPIGSKPHREHYRSEKGGIILCSNYSSCLGWKGIFFSSPGVGGDCSHIKLNKPFLLEPDKIYYGNNHFVHESIPVKQDVHRVLARVTLPENHIFEEKEI